MSYSPSHHQPHGPQRAEEFMSSHTDFLSHTDTSDPPNTECPICLEGITEHICIKITNVSGCKHMIGLQCLQEMLEHRPDDKKQCPLCRTVWIPGLGHWQDVVRTSGVGVQGVDVSFRRSIYHPGGSGLLEYTRVRHPGSRGLDTLRAGNGSFDHHTRGSPESFGQSREQRSMRASGYDVSSRHLNSRPSPRSLISSRHLANYTPMNFHWASSGHPGSSREHHSMRTSRYDASPRQLNSRSSPTSSRHIAIHTPRQRNPSHRPITSRGHHDPLYDGYANECTPS